jgi:hypothetical protein
MPERSPLHDDLDSGSIVKSLRLGWWRFQRCPVGGHWSIATPIRESDLAEQEKHLAREHRDIRIP